MSQVFAFNSRQIRTVTENNEIWFAAVDVCRALGLAWRINRLDVLPEQWKRSMQKFCMEGFPTRDLVFISEPAVYKLAFRSNKPEADGFTNWVASEVLPAIRKGGEYRTESRQQALPAGDSTAAMSSRRKETLELIERLLRDARNGFAVVRNLVQEQMHPGALSMKMDLTEREAYRILESFYVTADECLAGACNAIEAGYRFGRLFGKD